MAPPRMIKTAMRLHLKGLWSLLVTPRAAALVQYGYQHGTQDSAGNANNHDTFHGNSPFFLVSGENPSQMIRT
jgi:hypothetical protein